MSRFRLIACVTVIALSAVAIYAFVSWNRSNGSIPPEVQELIAGAKSHDIIDYPVDQFSHVQTHEAWYAMHQFVIDTQPQPFARRAKQVLTKDRGWQIVFPDLKWNPMSFQAEKRDTSGTPGGLCGI